MGRAVYCSLCERPVEARRKIGIGTLIVVVLTSGLWVLAIPFYRKRCPVCGGRSFVSAKAAQDLKASAKAGLGDGG